MWVEGCQKRAAFIYRRRGKRRELRVGLKLNFVISRPFSLSLCFSSLSHFFQQIHSQLQREEKMIRMCEESGSKKQEGRVDDGEDVVTGAERANGCVR